jgi:hypothetical protein
MCFVWISEQTATFALQNINRLNEMKKTTNKCTVLNRLVFTTEVESVYSVVRAESVYKTDPLRL